jgi:small subunit ribosomal protein S9
MMSDDKLNKTPVKRTRKNKESAPEATPSSEQAVLESRPVVAEKVPIRKQKKEKLAPTIKYFGTGRRKEAVAKVWLIPGSGKMVLNGRTMAEYFCGRKLLEYHILRPLIITNQQKVYDVYAQLSGGGVPGQAGALALGIARALLQVNIELKPKLKAEGLLTRDPRAKERKKYGLKRARRAFQYSKR